MAPEESVVPYRQMASSQPGLQDRPRRLRRWPQSLATVLLFGLSATTLAQGLEDDETLGPSIALGETDLYPSLRIDARQSDNVYRVADEPIEGSAVVVSPRLLWVADRRLLEVRGSYDGDYSVSSEKALEFTDHRLQLGFDTSPTKRFAGTGNFFYRRGHIEPGTNFTRGDEELFPEPVTFDQFDLSLRGRYGAQQARGNLGFGLRLLNRSYANFDDLTQGSNFVFVEPFASFSVRVAGDTRVFVEVRAAEVDYEADSRDRTDVSLFGGFSFAATERTFGQFQIGGSHSDYDAADIDAVTNVVAEGDIRYQPREYSSLRFQLRREIDDTNTNSLGAGVGSAITTLGRIDWAYDWSTRVTQTTFVELENIDRDCPEVSDTSTSAGLELALRLRRWIDLGLSVGGERRIDDECTVNGAGAADADDLDYDLLTYGLFVHLRL